ncbi:uncharacterized protein LOC121253688 [Juglans microcarpa x Juglans regia]|uniref:uncharacterized protein LOC121253688 n=1 Tax=Juglans microcarpa x Juglans regia TaxID=2249226 RepID=UPI001B7F48CE|nr:uncharacterized protein LOC121253688 [Juglans microcarpa x Juglans regia]
MGILHEEKVLEETIYSLEEKVSVFLAEDSTGDLDRSLDGEPEENNSDNTDPVERTLYWESREALLQEILDHYNLTVPKLRREISQTIEVVKEADFCRCSKPSVNGCTHCLRRAVVNLLCEKGFRATLCTSKWRHTRKYPGGTHEYIEVVASTLSLKKHVTLLMELEFRDQFKIAKACEEYHKLVSQLPEYYIGKPDHLNAIVHVVCDAAKKSMKEKKIHMGPWRKRSFMQMKWSGSSEQRQPSFEQSLSSDQLISSSLMLRQASTHESCLQFTAAPAVVVT